DASDDDKAALQHAQGGGQAEGARGRWAFEEDRLLTGGRDTDNRGARPLQVLVVVEVGNENIADMERTSLRKSVRDEGNAVGIEVGFWRHRRSREKRRWEIGDDGDAIEQTAILQRFQRQT